MIATISLPRLMSIGGGALKELPELLGRVGIKRPLIVTDPFMRSSGMLERLTGLLDRADIAWQAFSDTVPDPTTTVVEAGAAILAEGGFDGLVALGGGSPIDTAKAMAILAANGGRIRDYKVPNAIPKPGLPLIAIPTTAGTGSEVTRFTVITDVATDEKMLIAGLGVTPAAALIDYELTLTAPLRLTADTGIDALTHAIEAYVSRRANPVSDALALAAVRTIGANIERCYRDGANRPARAAMMIASMQAGMAFSNASVALVHGMSRPIGAHFHVAHGLSNAMLLPAVTRFSMSGAVVRYADCARAYRVASGSDNDHDAAVKLVEALSRLNRDLQVPTPQMYGISQDEWARQIPLMAQQAIASGSPANNPVVPDARQVEALYEQVYTSDRLGE